MSAAPDTIAALSSAVALAPRIILRLSGPDAVTIAQTLVPSSPIANRKSQIANRGDLALGTMFIPITLYAFLAPKSYTGEDLIEFHIPGSPALARMLLDELIHLGARQAHPGEFTARAYAHGRMDLTQAEGVAATISAANDAQLQAARRLLCGELARRLRPVMDSLAQAVALVEAGIDFSEEGISFVQPQQLTAQLTQVRTDLQQLLDQSVRFERLAHEPRIVLVGRPNAGKSTLLNALAGRPRAVVSDVPGTTRDALSAQVQLAHGLVQLVDVAGLEDQASADPLIARMRMHALRELETADLVLYVQDSTSPESSLDLPRRPDLLILTKIDLLPSPPNAVCVSALTGTNMPILRDRLDALAFGSRGDTTATSLALNARHVCAIAEAQAALDRALATIADAELCAADLRDALDALGQVLGQVAPDDLLARIFSSFCIGK